MAAQEFLSQKKNSSESHRETDTEERKQTKFIQGKHFALPNKSQLRRLKSRFLPLSVFHRQREKEISASLFSIRKQFL